MEPDRFDLWKGSNLIGIPSLRLGKIFGIPFEVNLSWIVIFALVAFTLSTGYYPLVSGASGSPIWVYWALGVITSLMFFASILAHELSHSLVMLASGGRVDKITLFIFGGVAEISDEPQSPGKEFLMAAAGPGMSLLIAGACYLGLAAATAAGLAWWITAPLGYLASINLFVAIFNLLPGFPLDGGRVLRSILWAVTGDVLKATKWAARCGQLIGWSMVGLAVVTALQGKTDFIWFGLIGWFIAWIAGASYRQQQVRSRLNGITVGQVMTPHPEYVAGEITLEQLAHEHFLGADHSRYPVLYQGQIVGVVSLPDAKSVERADWPYVQVIEVTDRDLARLSVVAETPVQDLLPRLAGQKTGAVLVVAEGRLAGIVTRADVMSILQEPAP
jgi:Zn-dependent protease/CBS domain-containing protein